MKDPIPAAASFVTEERLLRRIESDPGSHIQCRNLAALEGYLLGYDLACETWSLPPVRSVLDFSAAHRWLFERMETTAEHRSRLNAFNWLSLASWARFSTLDERDAFDAYLALWELAPKRASPEASQALPLPSLPRQAKQTFLEMLAPVSKKPGLYFGRLPKGLTVWAFCSGFRWAEIDHDCRPSLAEPVLTLFPAWLAERYPFAKGAPWHNLFDVLSTFHSNGAVECFEEHLRLFQEGRPADTADPQMIALWAKINPNQM